MAISKKNISSTSQNRKHQRFKPYPWQIEAATTETSSKKWIKIKAVSIYPSKWLESYIWTIWATSLLLTPINTLTRFFHYLINLSIILKSYTLSFKKKKNCIHLVQPWKPDHSLHTILFFHYLSCNLRDHVSS